MLQDYSARHGRPASEADAGLLRFPLYISGSEGTGSTVRSEVGVPAAF